MYSDFLQRATRSWLKEHHLNFLKGGDWDFIASNGSELRIFIKILPKGEIDRQRELTMVLGKILLEKRSPRIRQQSMSLLVMEKSRGWKKHCKTIPQWFRSKSNVHVLLVSKKGYRHIAPGKGIDLPRK